MTALLALAVLSGPAPLRLKLTPGAHAFYRIAAEQTTYGSDGKKTEGTASEMPFSFVVQPGNALEITKGPIVVRGRSLGRSRTSTEKVDGSRAPANFFVCLPPNGAKVGETWKAPFFGGPPLPAGMTASYKLLSVSGGFAAVDLKVDGGGANSVKGRGKLFLRTSDGFLDHGNAQFDLSFLRPDPKSGKLAVNSRVVLKYGIKQKG